MDPVALLAFNGGLQVFASSLLGMFMLVPLQPWGKGVATRVNMKSLLATHLDWLMLSFMQQGAAFMMSRWPETASPWTAWLLAFGGWTNVSPYLLRGFGINAFVLGGSWGQRAAAGIAVLSTAAILSAWSRLLLTMLSVLRR
ncbi:hypothetical protein [Myxococcus sp. AB036A]|uniref:hypothetical protein n=1 Tax=Myxococcus sp. AB036A TaxID=2562793 RepID=UPI001E338462|nr:hypothetical protein [Myxococcus sp. AB036A]